MRCLPAQAFVPGAYWVSSVVLCFAAPETPFGWRTRATRPSRNDDQAHRNQDLRAEAEDVGRDRKRDQSHGLLRCSLRGRLEQTGRDLAPKRHRSAPRDHASEHSQLPGARTAHECVSSS
jgi:hypothetical protein